MKTKLISFALLLMILISCDTKSQNKDKIYWGDKVKIESRILGQSRDLYIYVPYDYDRSKESYPVLITTDAEVSFYFAASTAEVMANQAKIPKMIVIGILNRGRDNERLIDFAPKVDTIPQSGQGELFIQFIEKELKPYIEKNYRTQPFWILQGHSFLGMFSAHTLMTKPNLFNAMIISSPGLRLLENEIDNALPSIQFETPKFIYLSRGDKEPIEIAEKELSMLKTFAGRLSTIKNVYVKEQINNDEDHQSNSMISIINGLKFIFDGYITSKPYRDCTMNELEEHYISLSEKYGYEMPIPERIKKQVKK